MKRKLKTKKSLAKRIKITKRGKLLRRRAGKSHLLSGKTRKRKRALSRPALVGSSFLKKLKAGLPYR